MQELYPFILAGLVSGSIYGIAAVGLVLTYKTSGIFNFAHGSIAAMAAGLFYALNTTMGVPWPIAAIVSVVVVAVVFGWIMERFAHVLVGVSTAMKVVATVALMISITSIFQLWYGFETLVFPAFLPSKVVSIGSLNVSSSQLTIVIVGLAAMILLGAVLRYSALGRDTKAVIDDPTLFELAGRSATRVRRRSWMIGSGFAGVSGLLLAPSVGLDGTSLTLLVVGSFGAAAIGRFTNLPLAYVGALALGVIGSMATKYAVDYPILGSLPSGLPFIVLVIVLISIPRRRLIDLGAALERRVAQPPKGSLRTRAIKLGVPVAILAVVPFVVGVNLPIWSQGLIFIILFLSLGLVVRTSNQVSLCHISFAAIGAVSFYKFLEAGVPWLLSILLAGAVVIPVGALIAVPAIRLPGVFLGLATLGFGILLEQQIYNTDWMFGQAGTTLFVPRPDFAVTQRDYYYVVLVFVLLAYGVIKWADGGQLGRLLRAKADSSVALASLGTSVRTPPVLAFCVSAFLAGVAGALSGPVFEIIGPGSFQTIPTSLMLVALIVLAGADPRIGPFGVAVGGAVGMVILPGYISNGTLAVCLNLLFAGAAVYTAIISGKGPRSPKAKRRRKRPASELRATEETGAEMVGTNPGRLA